VALVAAPPIVELVYERGAFVGSDTEAVVLITRILVPGFVAEGLWLVIAQAMLATGRIGLVLRVWTVRFVAQLILTTLLGSRWGASGVAAAYAVSMLISTGVAAMAARNLGILGGGSPLLIRALGVGLLTAGAAVGLVAAGDWISPWVAAVAVLAVVLVGGYRWGLLGTVVATLRGERTDALDSKA
jgi:putative peptidoglycan lipid II flippase